MLRIHFLNVQHGDSIVLQQVDGDYAHFAVIDSNVHGRGTPAALRKLRELGAERLSFVLLTHPHRDHFRGLLPILEEYRGRIGSFFIFPLGEFIPSRIKSLAMHYLSLCERQDDDEVTRAAEEFVGLLKFIYETWKHEVNQFAGEQVALLPEEGFNGIDLYTILPPNRAKGIISSK